MGIFQSMANEAMEIVPMLRSIGRHDAERGTLWNAAENLMAVATTETAIPESGREFLIRSDIRSVLHRLAELNNEASRAGTALLLQPELVHLSWFVGELDFAESHLSQLADPRNESWLPATPFWKGYCRAMVAFARGEAINDMPLKAEGVENFWGAYLKLMAALSRGQNVQQQEDEVAAVFSRRQSDKRWQSYSFEGSPKYPAKWDLRKESIYAWRRG